MRRNVFVITITAVIFGLSFGIYDLVLPLWLKDNNISYAQMGWIYAASNLMMMLVPIGAGWLADLFGRKRFFSASLACCAVACLITPMTASVAAQTILRVLQRAASGVYEALQGVLVFETSSAAFLLNIRLARGFEFTCHALGALVVYLLVMGRTGKDVLALPMFLAFGLLLVSFVLVVGWLREPPPEQAATLVKKRINLFGLPRVLILMAAFNFVFQIGLSISHSQMQLLFFEDKFDLAKQHVAVISILHRMSLGIPMMLAAFWVTRPNRGLFVFTVVLEGLFVSATVFPTSVVGAVAVWFVHDPIGAAIWVPMNAWFMQEYARPERRASDVATVLAMSTLGMAIGPLIAGWLADYSGPVPSFLSGSIDLPFFVSGLVVTLSGILVCFLPKPSRTAGG